MVPLDAHARLLPDPAHSRKGNVQSDTVPGLLGNVYRSIRDSATSVSVERF
ncbi:hypothetical protein RCH11_000974 [Glaciihabitans sp. GrIS 2.15]|nr:hypothetical protein [Glaciihabitans sp. GrIS 2.15]